MKLREKIKRFWTLDVHNHEGFTLVELIIVIAILAILSSVAVVGYSSYVKKANMQADQTLAAEIKNALMLAMYSDVLTAGDYVVIRADGNIAAYGNEQAGTSSDKNSTIYKAMAAAYGDGWENSLKLKYADWDLGVVADATMMQYVEDSTYTGSGFGTMLGQVQNVVNIAGNYFNANTTVDDALLPYLEKTGVTLGEGNTVLEGTGNAVANSTVFYVANSISGVSVTNDYLWAWATTCTDGKYQNLLPFYDNDKFAAYSATYAAVLGLATYVDTQTAGSDNPSDYVNQLRLGADINDGAAFTNKLTTVAQDINTTYETIAAGYLTCDADMNLGGQLKTDAMAFQAYMEGVEKASDSILANNDIYSNDFFSDGTMENYVRNYVDIGSVLSELGISGDAFAFIYDGSNIVCVPLDY